MNHPNPPRPCWDFRDAQTRTFTNCFHRYPAMMVPQVVDELVRQLGRPGMTLLDPFCGTGRALIAGRLAGLHCLGVDVNPLAVLIATTKLRELDPAYLRDRLRAVLARVDNSRSSKDAPKLIGLDADYWFATATRAKLGRLLRAVQRVFSRECAAKDFFFVALSETIRDCSWTRKSEFKLYRMPPAAIAQFDPDPVALFQAKVQRNIDGMRAYRSALGVNPPSAEVVLADAKRLQNDGNVSERLGDGVDLILTSPPYGDARTTVDYGNFSRLSLAWLATDEGFARRWHISEEVVTRVNHRCLGGLKHATSAPRLRSRILDETLDAIAQLDEGRADDVQRFFADLAECLVGMTAVLAPGGNLCLIVANRKVKGHEIPTNRILNEMASRCDLSHSVTMDRQISGKRLPARINTNSGHLGETSTMTNEYIMVFTREQGRCRLAA